MPSPAEAAALPPLTLAAADVSQSAPFSGETRRGAVFLAARYGLGVMVSVGNMLVMTWWIGPHVYGLFVTAVGIVAFLAVVARGGVDTYLVRSDAPSARLYGTATAVMLGASIGIGLAAAAATPLLVRWYGSREFVAPYLALLMAVPVSALTAIPMAKLERGLEFRRIAGIELAGQSLGLIVAASLAWFHAGVWAPVAGQIVWQLFILIATSAYAAVPFSMCFDLRHARPMLTYGLGLTASLRTWQLRTLVNPLIVGRLVGTEGVAYVALAIRIAEALGSFRLAAGRMAIAALSRLQECREDFRRTLELALYVQVVTLGPLLCAFALLGPYVVRHIIGARWMPSMQIYPFAAAGVLVNSVYNLQASALFVVGKQWMVMQSYLAHVVLLAATTIVLVPRLGLVGYGWAELVACSAYCLIHSGLAGTVQISYQRLRPWVAGFVAGLFLIPITRHFALIDLQPLRSHTPVPTIAYLSNLFPSPVEPYVVDEIQELRRRGTIVIPCSVRKAPPALDSGLRSLASETLYLQRLRIGTLLHAIWLCATKLSALSDFVRQALMQGRESPQRRLKAVIHTLLGVYYAASLRSRHADHIHVHHGYFGSWIAMVAARLLGISFSMTLHGSDLLLNPAFLDLKLKRSSFCVTISEFNRRHILKHYPTLEAGKILARHLGVDDAILRLGNDEPNPVFSILTVGRLHPVKNHAFLIQACWLLKCRGLRFTCGIAGEGPERACLEGMILDFGLQNEVRLLGQLSRDQLDEQYGHADLVVLTSHSEGIPLVLMEAMVRGKPVLAPSITGIPELIADGETGFLYQAGSLDEFMAQIAFVRSARSALGPLVQAARQHVLKHFNRKTNLAAVCDLFTLYHHAQPVHAVAASRENASATYEDTVLQ